MILYVHQAAEMFWRMGPDDIVLMKLLKPLLLVFVIKNHSQTQKDLEQLYREQARIPRMRRDCGYRRIRGAIKSSSFNF